MIKSILNINAHAFAKIALGFGLVLLAVAAILLATSGGRRMVGITLAPSDVVVEVKSGDTLSTILIQHNLTGRDINEIDRELRKCDVRSLRAGSDQLVISRPDEETAPNSITLICGPWKRVEITRDDGGWSAHTIEVERDIRMVHRTGRIRDGDSFYNAARRAGMPSGIIIDVYDLLSFEIDFERDVRAGQEFSVLYEEHFADGVKAGNGAVVALSFDSLRGNVKMYRFRKNDGTFGYYDENGNGAVKALKRTPINNARVSSGFGNRRHPVLGFTRQHKGVDFRAAHGTPIPSAGAGRVVERKNAPNGYGLYIRIRHNNTFDTLYAHMSRFANGVNVGTNVKQGQIIGYVGSTGLSTGPHLHYEIIKNGVHVNPLTVKFPSIDNLDAKSKERFFPLRDNIDRAIETLRNHPDMFVQM